MPYTPEQINQILNAVNAGGTPQPASRGTVTVLGMEPTPEVYPYDAYQQQYNDNQKRRSVGEQYIAQQMLAAPKFAEPISKALKGILDADVPKMQAFEETEPAKSIFSALPDIRRNDRMISNIRNELTAAEKIKDKVDKVDRLQTIVPKLLQSAASGGSDAMQMGEFLLGAPEMQNYSRWTTANRMEMGLSSLVKYLNDPSIKDRFDVNPDSYLSKAKDIYNSIASSRNTILKQFEAQSSPEWVASKTGLKPLELFKSDIEAELGGAAPAPTVAPSVAPAKSESKRIRYEMRGGTLMRIQD
jgi:hypothetical protein